MVKYMFENRALKWKEELKIGQMVPLFKKGDRNDRNNYRGRASTADATQIMIRIEEDVEDLRKRRRKRGEN